MMRNRVRRCLFADCIAVAVIRGCCRVHYQHYAYRVNRGDYTWKQLEAAGKVAEPAEKVVPEMKRANENAD